MSKSNYHEQNSSVRMEILSHLLQNNDGYVKSDSVPFVFEITIDLRKLVIDIVKGIQQIQPNNNTSSILAWCCFSGIGATMHWNINSNELNQVGIFKMLTRERGIFELDEYVLDLIGIPFGSIEAEDLTDHIRDMSTTATIQMAKYSINESQETLASVFLEACEAMYWYGMAIQMSRLGM